MKMHKKISILCFTLIFFSFAGCSQAKHTEKLPDEKPKDFGFVFNYGVGAKNQLDTAKGKFTKDMIVEPSVITDLKLTEEEMNNIYSQMKKINILSYPNNFKPRSNMRRMPVHSYTIKIIYGVREKNIEWEDESASDSSDAVQLRELFKKIEEIIANREEYKKLPKAKGGYD